MSLSKEDKDYFTSFVGNSKLHSTVDRAVLSLMKSRYETDLAEWTIVMGYATKDTKAFELILNKIEELIEVIIRANSIIKLL